MVSVNVFPFLLFILDVHENELAEELDKMIDMIKGGLSLKIKKNTYSSVLHRSTQYFMKVYPSGRYRQLNSYVLIIIY